MTLLVAVNGWTPELWFGYFRSVAGDLDIVDARDVYDPAMIRYAAVWKPQPGLLASLPNLQVIFNLGAGVDAIMADTTRPALPIVRVVDPDMTGRMTEYVVWQVLHHLRHGFHFAAAQARRQWRVVPNQPSASELRVGIMGLGVLGRDAAEVLARMRFQVAGWSRRGESIANVEGFAGEAQLDAFLARTDILVVLLPLTDATRGILNRALFAKLAQGGRLGGPVVINAGRGGLQVEADIVAALSDGTLKGASLDVFEPEPLSPDSPLWNQPGVAITPHVAADSDPRHIARYVVNQVRRHMAGEPLENVVDPGRGY